MAAAPDLFGAAALGDEAGPGRRGRVIRRHPETGERHMDWLTWGLLPHGTANPAGAPRPLYARAETVATLPVFAEAFRRRRAIVPATAYYQRRTTAAPKRWFAIARRDGEPLAMAGLWAASVAPDGAMLRTYCLVTVAANADVAPIHDRMPLVLEAPDWPLWLGEQPGDPAALLHPSPAGVLIAEPVRPPRRAG